jgi:hypothetical protein
MESSQILSQVPALTVMKTARLVLDSPSALHVFQECSFTTECAQIRARFQCFQVKTRQNVLIAKHLANNALRLLINAQAVMEAMILTSCTDLNVLRHALQDMLQVLKMDLHVSL